MSHITGHGQLNPKAEPFDPAIGFLPVEDKPFALFQQLQAINTHMQRLQHHINTVSIPALNQINDQLLRLNYISNPTYYFQLQQQQAITFQTVQQQKQQHRILKQSANKIQAAYHKALNPEPESPQPQPQSTTTPPSASPPPSAIHPIHSLKELQSTALDRCTEPTNYNKSPALSMIIEADGSEINDDVASTESPEYQLTLSMADTVNEGTSTANEFAEPSTTDQDDHTSSSLCMAANDGETHQYPMTDLVSFQPQFVDMDWSQNAEIPLDIRFIGSDFDHRTFMDDMLAAISRRCVHRFSDRNEKVCDDTKRKNMKKLKGILNRMTPTKFAKIAKETMDVISVYAQSKDEMEDILRLILEFGTQQSVFSDQYAKLIAHLFDYLPRLRIICDYDWIISDDQLSKTFRTMVIVECHKLFYQYINHSVIDMEDTAEDEAYDVERLELTKAKQKKTFIDFLKLCGDLYNVDMISIGVIYKGIIDELLPPKNGNVSEIDIEGICGLFKQCGDKLDEEKTVRVDVYLKKVKKLAHGFGFRTQCLVDGIQEMRLKDWTHRIHKEKPKQLDVLKKEFDEEQQKKLQVQLPKMETRRQRKDDYYHYYGAETTHATKRRSRSTNSRKANKRRSSDGYDYEYEYYYKKSSSSHRGERNGNNKRRRSKSKGYRQEDGYYYHRNGSGYDEGEHRGYDRRDTASYDHSRSRRRHDTTHYYYKSYAHTQRHRSYGDYY